MKVELPKIGDEFFVVTHAGHVYRTAVTTLTPNGYKCFINMHAEWTFKSPDEAISCAKKLLEEATRSGDYTRAEEELLQKQLAKMESSEFRKDLLAQSFHEISNVTGQLTGKAIPIGQVFSFPEEYALPGDKLFGIVRPRTHYSELPKLNLPPYFILEGRIHETLFLVREGGHIKYSMAETYFTLDSKHLFLDLESAKTEMTSIFAKETRGSIQPGNIPIVNVSEEVSQRDQIMGEIQRDHFQHRRSLG